MIDSYGLMVNISKGRIKSTSTPYGYCDIGLYYGKSDKTQRKHEDNKYLIVDECRNPYEITMGMPYIRTGSYRKRKRFWIVGKCYVSDSNRAYITLVPIVTKYQPDPDKTVVVDLDFNAT